MTINVGVIGVGMIGQDHVRRLTHVLSGARVAAVTDVDPAVDAVVGCGSAARARKRSPGPPFPRTSAEGAT
ncbi:MAG: Gfo/Idh/MocA family oxidoreductase [Pseudonocardia sp.]|nr:Gfo/Idh/MocA family oxidoreductase [Pseudonocardia sp.]